MKQSSLLYSLTERPWP